MAEPHCPECRIEGLAHIVSKESVERSRNRDPWFTVVHCSACGHVYGVFAKHVFGGGTTVPRFVVPRS
jgi:uncharacterized Zn finger protein